MLGALTRRASRVGLSQRERRWFASLTDENQTDVTKSQPLGSHPSHAYAPPLQVMDPITPTPALHRYK